MKIINTEPSQYYILYGNNIHRNSDHMCLIVMAISAFAIYFPAIPNHLLNLTLESPFVHK